MKIRKELRWFACAMERKLRANDFKGGWEDMTRDALFAELRGEVDELRFALKVAGKADALRRNPPKSVLEDIINECADVANMAMMLADNSKVQP